MNPLQAYYECESFATDDCPHRENPVLKKREFLLGDFNSNLYIDFGTEEEKKERKRICKNCDKFVRIKF